jgi:hypothetical protein
MLDERFPHPVNLKSFSKSNFNLESAKKLEHSKLEREVKKSISKRERIFRILTPFDFSRFFDKKKTT